MSKTYGTLSSLDLALCSSSIVDRFSWTVLDDLYTSDHFPVTLDYIQDSPTACIPKFNFNKADWKKFEVETKEVDPFNAHMDHDNMNTYFKEFTLNAAKQSIPMSSNNIKKRTVPWWNGELSDLVREKTLFK